MDLATQVLFYIATLSVLIFTFALFLGGLRIIQRAEDEQWRQHWQEKFKQAVEMPSNERRG